VHSARCDVCTACVCLWCSLPLHKLDLIHAVEPGTTALFLFDQTYRYLHGVYDAACAPGVDLDPSYLRTSTTRSAAGRGGQSGASMPAAASDAKSPFPAQVRFGRVHDFKPIAESKFCHLVAYNAGTNVFRHRLGEKETHALLRLLAHPEEAPKENVLPYETNGYRRSIPENPKFREQRRALYGE